MDKLYMETEKAPKIENSAEITLESFAKLVKQMRHNQRRYFNLRRPEILTTCKELEKQVDEAVRRITDKQPTLF